MGTDLHFRYCPRDGTLLESGAGAESTAPCCPECGYVDYNNPRPCVALIVLRDGKVLLARSGNEPEKYRWDLPGGFIEQGESAEGAVGREGREETGVDLRVTRVLGPLADAADPDGAVVPTPHP